MDPKTLTVLVPGFNCAEYLDEHSEKLTSLRDRGAKIVWLITPGADGTEKKAQAIAARTGDDFLQTPKGLYEAWNFGVASVKTKFLYFSTINDFPIQSKALFLCEALELTGADICFSPPEKVCPKGLKNKLVLSWPVYLYKNFLKDFTYNCIPVPALIAMQVNSGLSCLLGSWASVVAKTSFMKQRPFPLNFGHHSDSLWFYQNLLDAKIVFYPNPVAFFAPWSSTKKKEFSDIELISQYRRCVTELFRKSRTRGKWLKKSFGRFRKFYALLYNLNKYRGPHPKRYWWVNPKNWYLRFWRDIAAFQLAAWHKHWKAFEPKSNPN